MMPRIAIPVPTSLDSDYNEHSLRPYLAALEAAGATGVVIPLGEPQEQIARRLQEVSGILLPGSRYDVDPESYGESRIPECADADPGRTAVDELLLQDGFNLHKPILAICYGIQALSVWCNGSLLQDLETQLGTRVNHKPGRDVERAHRVEIREDSRLASIAQQREQEYWVNSSHHQAIRTVGGNLCVNAVSPEDGVIEGVELDSSSHFVLGVQWHPERTHAVSPLSEALFAEFVRSAASWQPRRIEESVAHA
jgi:putative glutamine amidotransferase